MGNPVTLKQIVANPRETHDSAYFWHILIWSDKPNVKLRTSFPKLSIVA